VFQLRGVHNLPRVGCIAGGRVRCSSSIRIGEVEIQSLHLFSTNHLEMLSLILYSNKYKHSTRNFDIIPTYHDQHIDPSTENKYFEMARCSNLTSLRLSWLSSNQSHLKHPTLMTASQTQRTFHVLRKKHTTSLLFR
jgi:hypothetical protein